MKIGIMGCAGRMGQMLAREVDSSDLATLIGGTEKPGSPFLGEDLGKVCGIREIGITVIEDACLLFQSADTIIDFTTPESTINNARLAEKSGASLVIGTTGCTKGEIKELKERSKKIVIVHAANFSIGVNLLLGLAQKSASVLGVDYDAEICEMHHKHKVDAPSGTALSIGEAIAKGAGIDLNKSSTRTRDGIIGPRENGTIGFATLRGGSVVGEHTVIFAGDGERVELVHKATDRGIFAKGALRAALWTKNKKAGYYSMLDVLEMQ